MANDQIIPITRPGIVSAMHVTETKFPSEVINLPSKGWFYPSDTPLSTGTLELKMMTAKEEDILTSPNLIQKGIALDRLLDSVIVNKAIVADEMLVCDRNAAFFAIRRLAYGDKYDAQITCGRCYKETFVTIDLGKMDNRPFDFSKYSKGENRFEYMLPMAKIPITFKLLSKKDENSIATEVTGMEKITKEVSRASSIRLCHVITSVDGNTERVRIRKFVNDEMLSRDSLALRNYIRETMPDIDSSFEFVCSHCSAERKEETPMGVSFFWPGGRV